LIGGGIRNSVGILLSCGDEVMGGLWWWEGKVLLLGVSANMMVFWSDFSVSSKR